MKKVIVTGANGFIGTSLIGKLVNHNIKVIAIDIEFKENSVLDNELVTKIKIDLNNVSKLENQFVYDDYDAFYHFAWKGVNGPNKADPVVQLENAQITVNCARIAKKIGCKKILCSGTIAEQSVHSLVKLKETSGGMMYGVAKYSTRIILETYCKSIGMNFIWMQFSNIYGPSNKTGNIVSYTLNELIAGRAATFGPAMQPYDFIYVDDLVEAVYRLGYCDNSQNFYYIGSGESRILKEYLIEIGRAYGREDLIKIGLRPDDGVVYTKDMFEIEALVDDIGPYVSKTFDEGIRYTINNY